jgi:hypothetical protein
MPPRPRPRPPPRLWPALSVCLLLLPTFGAPAEAAAAASEAKAFEAFVSAWKARAADGVAASIETRGSARFHLFDYPLSGRTHRMKPAQAKASLEKYFKRLSGVRLKDVTAPRTPASVRLYEYTYTPDRENKRTTHLQVQLKQDRGRRWVLASVTESARPRK